MTENETSTVSSDVKWPTNFIEWRKIYVPIMRTADFSNIKMKSIKYANWSNRMYLLRVPYILIYGMHLYKL